MDSIKIIIMVTWIGLNVLPGTESDDDIFMIGNKRCITNGSAALAIIKKISDTDEEYDNKVASYYPKSESKCTFENNTNNCGKIDVWKGNSWNICRAMDGPIKHYVTDRRWQDFPVKKFPSSPNIHKAVLELSNFKIFTIPLSFRIESDGFVQLSLCDKKNRGSADCYCIRLTETQSNIWKCSQLYIIDNPNYDNYYCKKLDNGQAIKPFGDFNEDAWTHLSIVRNYTMIQLLRENDVIMTYYDEEPIFDTKRLLIYSERGSLWKVHDYHYLFSETPNHSSEPIGPVINISKNTTCISMFVAMCQTCCLTITTSLQNDEEIAEETKHYLSTPDGMWTEKKLIIDTHKHVGNTMSILHFKHHCNGHSNKGLFWAIDDIRLCEEKEYSYIQSDEEKFTCQKIGIGQNEILKIDNNDISKKGIDCPENTFGKFCVPCSMFGSENDYCANFAYCELDHSEEACHCTAGYDGVNCLGGCYWGFYGHGCQKECPKNCINKRCHENGTCLRGCENPFTGSACSESTVTFFKYAPNATTVTSTTGMIQVEDFAVETAAGSMPPLFYNIEYCEDPDQTVNRTSRNLGWKIWNIAGETMKFNEESQAKIDHLMPDTFYLVRAIFLDQTTGDYIKESRFRTKCTDIVDENIVIETTSDSATIEIQWASDKCKSTKYKLICNNVEITKNLSKPIQLVPLQPYTEYNCTIKPAYSQDNIVKTFWTKEGVPSEVQEVETVSDANSISLKWKEPVTTNGKIIRYDIVYYYLGSRISSCMPVHEMFNASTPQLNIILKGLKLYSKYQIMIYAVTNGGQGKEHKESIETMHSDNISREEMLAVDTFEIFSDAVKISVTKLDCEDLTGPIHIQGNASCIHEWCAGKNVSKRVKYSPDSNYIKLTGLFAYSNYTAYLAFSRDRISWNHIGNITFQTKPSVPKSISNLEVISKDDTSISLRWMKPYPPTGVLKQYCIEYSYYYIYFNSRIDGSPKYISPLPCPLWKDYHCAKLTGNLYDGYTYDIKIRARNENPNTYGPASEITVKIQEEASYPTYGISLLWDEKNDLNITWYHPNNTNGALRSFQIHLETKRRKQTILEEYVPVNETNYSLTYTKTVNSTKLQACTEYRASIVVHNRYAASSSKYSSATSPPDIPPNIPIENLITEKTNTTISVHVPIVGSNSTLYQEKIYILVSKAADNDDLELFEQNLLKKMDGIPNLKSSRIVYGSNRANSPLDFRIGDNNQSDSSLDNPPLEPGTNYSVTIIMSNQCANTMRLSRAQKYVSTVMKMTETNKQTGNHPVPDESNGGLWALILLLFVPLIGFGYWYKKYKDPKGSDLLIPHERTKPESIALSRMPNPGGRVLSMKPKRSLPQALPPLNTTHSKPIKISDFEEYVKGVVTSGELNRQHSLFPRGLVKPCEYGSLAENKAKNRYKNLIAYDETRVKLQKIRGEEYSDYINANYIDGYKKPRCYIATQGPKTNTLEDFWRMIWQEKVRHIVMLANVYENGKKKVEKYWPDINENLTFGNVRVQHVSADIFSNFDIREFTIHCNNEERKINQLHFTTWPDHGVPLYSQSLVPFLQRVLKIPYNPQSPIVVHCSAGVGRTGTIILSDICLRMAAGEGSIDFLAYLENIRSQRANLVDNIEQYKLAHLVVLECLFGLHTAVPCNKEMKKIVDGIVIDYGIQKQMKYIVETQWQDSAMETMLEHEEVFPNYPEKNRFKEIIPRHYRVFLTKYPVDDDASFYINAVQVDGFRNPGRYISTQQPMPNTLGDFWRMVVERSCTTIISLNVLNLKDKTVCKFWPGNGEELNPLDIIRVQHIKTKRLECYKVITVQVIFIREEPFTVDILEMDNWKSNELLPNSIEEFLAFLDASEAISRNSERVIVTCHDGATASGLYLAMTFLIEKMKLEQECDVCLAVRTIRHSRKEFVTKEEQYEFLYRASVTFIAGFQSYANFT